MLLKVMHDSIVQRCDACGARRELTCASLEAGVAFGDPPTPMSPDIIALPACSSCGAREFLQRVASTDPAEVSETAEHRRGVNALHAALVAAGRTAPGIRELIAKGIRAADTAVIPWSFSAREGGE